MTRCRTFVLRDRPSRGAGGEATVPTGSLLSALASVAIPRPRPYGHG